jgi:hypothetical protein
MRKGPPPGPLSSVSAQGGPALRAAGAEFAKTNLRRVAFDKPPAFNLPMRRLFAATVVFLTLMFVGPQTGRALGAIRTLA